MKKSVLFIGTILFAMTSIVAQNIENKWQFETVTDEQNQALFNIDEDSDFLILENGKFEYHLSAKNNLKASGNFDLQETLLVFNYTQPTDTIRYYRISEKTDSTLIFTENNIQYKFKKSKLSSDTILVAEDIASTGTIIPNQGFSLTSLWRGVLGMLSLIFIAFLFSSNRKAINWKTVGIGLSFQLVIAVGVLKVEFVKIVFEYIGQGFIAILGFTQAGSEFLFGGMLDVNSFGYIFAFQVLPTIIFFSALTSVISSIAYYNFLLSTDFCAILFRDYPKSSQSDGMVINKIIRNLRSRKLERCW